MTYSSKTPCPDRVLPSTLHTSHCTLHSSHSKLQTSHSTLHTPHFSLLTASFTVQTSNSTLHTAHFTLHSPHFTLHTSQSTLHTSHFTLQTSHFTLHSPHFTLRTSHSKLHTSHFALHSSRSTLHTALFCLSWHPSLHTPEATLKKIDASVIHAALTLKQMDPAQYLESPAQKTSLSVPRTSSHPRCLLVHHHRGLGRSGTGLPLAPLAHALPPRGVLGLLPMLDLLESAHQNVGIYKVTVERSHGIYSTSSKIHFLNKNGIQAG